MSFQPRQKGSWGGPLFRQGWGYVKYIFECFMLGLVILIDMLFCG